MLPEICKANVRVFWLNTLNSNASQPITVYGDCHSILAAAVKTMGTLKGVCLWFFLLSQNKVV